MKYISSDLLAQGVVLSPAEIERELVHIVEQIEANSAILVRESEQLADVSLKYDLAYAQAMVRAKGRSAEQRKAEVLMVVEELYREKTLCESRLRLCRDAQHDLRAELEAIRSIGASVRSSMWEQSGTGGSQGGSTRRPGDPR